MIKLPRSYITITSILMYVGAMLLYVSIAALNQFPNWMSVLAAAALAVICFWFCNKVLPKI